MRQEGRENAVISWKMGYNFLTKEAAVTSSGREIDMTVTSFMLAVLQEKTEE